MAKITPLKVALASATALSGAKKPPIQATNIVIKKPNMARAAAKIIGTAPYMQNNFSSDNKAKMEATQREGSASKKTRKAKPPKDFDKVYQGSMHISKEGWHGIPATALRNAMIEACRLTEMDMIRAKMCVFIVADGYDNMNSRPLVKINGKPRMDIDRVKIGMNQTDLAVRALFEKWDATVTIEWDADVFAATDVFNLLARAGWQVGIGAGRPLSKTSGGIGYGTFRVET